jgi:hypothetical protein
MKLRVLLLTIIMLMGAARAQATSTSYGSGCGQYWLQTAELGLPVLGSEVILETHGHRTLEPGRDWCATLFMAGRYSIYHSMGGVNNCLLLQSVDYMAPMVFGPMFIGGDISAQRLRIVIPLVPALVGTHVYWQAANFSPNANPGSVTFDNMLTSNGVDWRIDL